MISLTDGKIERSLSPGRAWLWHCSRWVERRGWRRGGSSDQSRLRKVDHGEKVISKKQQRRTEGRQQILAMMDSCLLHSAGWETRGFNVLLAWCWWYGSWLNLKQKHDDSSAADGDGWWCDLRKEKTSECGSRQREEKEEVGPHHWGIFLPVTQTVAPVFLS